MVFRLCLLLILSLPCVLSVWVPVGFHGTDNASKWSMLKGIKTQAAVGNKESQILGSGTYFGVVPSIANKYAQVRCNQRKTKPSKNAAVLIIGVEEAYARIEDNIKNTPIKATLSKEWSPFFSAVRDRVTDCKEYRTIISKQDPKVPSEKEIIKKNEQQIAQSCSKKPPVVNSFNPKSCPVAEFVVLDEFVVSKNGAVALGHYNVWEINSAKAPQNGAFLIEQHKTKYWFYPNINLITKELTADAIFQSVNKFIEVSSASCSDAAGWAFAKIEDEKDTVDGPNAIGLLETVTDTQTQSYSRSRLKTLRGHQQTLQP